MSESSSLYERIGGGAAIESLIPTFYARVLADPDLAPFFANSQMDRLQHMQREFLSMALGGPVTYTGVSLAHAHHGRGITAKHFGKFVSHLMTTLKETGMSPEDADAVIARVDTFANEVTGTSY